MSSSRIRSSPAGAASPVARLPPELLARVVELAVEGLPPTVRLRSAVLRNLALVAQPWVEPAQRALESRVHIDSYGRARNFLDRARPADKPLVLDELVLFYDFAPLDEDFYPLTELMTRSICASAGEIRSLHLRSALFMSPFDLTLLLLPSFAGLRELKLSMPLEPPAGLASLPMRLEKLALSAMVDQPPSLFRLLARSLDTLRSLQLFVIKSGAPLHERLLDAVPALPSQLAHLAITTHWVPLPGTLVRFIQSCSSLRVLSLEGLVTNEVLELLPALSTTSLIALDLTVPATFIWFGSPIESFFDRLLRETTLRNLRSLTVTRRIESGSDEQPQRLVARLGPRDCECVYEVTARRPLP